MSYFRCKRDWDVTLVNATALNRSAFFKLLALGLFDFLLTLPLTILQLLGGLLQDNIAGFWPGWNISHASFLTIPTFTSEEWRSAGFWAVFGFRFGQWINPLFAIVFFLLFGLTDKKCAWYRSIFWRVMQPLGFKTRVHPLASDIVFVSNPVFNSEIHNSQVAI